MQSIMEAHPYQLESIITDESCERRQQDNDYEHAYRIVQDWLGAAELRTMYPNEMAALKLLLGRI
jgi:hypothetical protein